MNIMLKSLAITSFDSNVYEKVKFVKELSKDKLVNRLYCSIDKMIEESEKSDTIIFGCGYIISDNNNFVGFIRPSKIIDNGVLDIDYAVRDNYRHQGYGTRILKETADYFLNNYDDIEIIKLIIDGDNVNSMNCAEKAGFMKTDESYPHFFSTYIKRR